MTSISLSMLRLPCHLVLLYLGLLPYWCVDYHVKIETDGKDHEHRVKKYYFTCNYKRI